jgi:DNA polymerase-4
MFLLAHDGRRHDIMTSLRWTDEARLKWLFLDLNSYFASVEQQDDPALRGKPIIVAPVMADTSFAIAASHEAKAFGVRTGTRIGDAKRMCPGLICVPARHDVYVDYHHRIVDEIERHVHVSKICSIDEVACALTGPEKLSHNAVALARRVKAGITSEVGECLGSSIGLAPSRLLAKIASNLQKPDGLTVLGADALPGRLLDLDLIALPGIGSNMRRRLNAAGIHSVSDFWALTPGRARKVWGGIGGEGFWYALHGLDPPEMETKRGSIGHSHVLAPELRAPGAAFGVARRLMTKTASRLRRMGYRASVLTLSIRLERGGNLACEQRFPATSDSFALLRALENAALDLLPLLGSRLVRKIGVTLSALAPVSEEQPDLFGWTPASDEHAERLKLSDALDRLNARYGRDTVSIGAAARLPRYTGTKVAFNRIPDRAEFRE